MIIPCLETSLFAKQFKILSAYKFSFHISDINCCKNKSEWGNQPNHCSAQILPIQDDCWRLRPSGWWTTACRCGSYYAEISKSCGCKAWSASCTSVGYKSRDDLAGSRPHPANRALLECRDSEMIFTRLIHATFVLNFFNVNMKIIHST